MPPFRRPVLGRPIAPRPVTPQPVTPQAPAFGGPAVGSMGPTRPPGLPPTMGRPIRPISSMKKGGTAKKSGVYRLHRGERVPGRKMRLNKLLG